MAVKPVPEGYHTITPGIAVEGCEKAMELYKKALGAEQRGDVARGPGGSIMHAELKIGDSVIMMNDVAREMGMNPTTGNFYLYVTDCDAWYKRAVAAGMKSIMEPADQFWGDRFGCCEDPYGNKWNFATHKEDLTPEEIQRRQSAWMKQMASGQKP
jgi:PhnB protein